MTYYKHILVAIDFSKLSIKSVVKAQQIAANSNSVIELIHVVDIPIYPILEDIAVTRMLGIWEDDFAQQLLTASEIRLKAMAKRYQVSHTISVAGKPSTEIIAIATANHMDLIIMGLHGTSGLQSLIGSTTHAVINDAPCDVLSIK